MNPLCWPRIAASVVIATAAGLAAPPSWAGLDGRTVVVSYLAPNRDTLFETATVTVGPRNEVTFFDGGLKVDLSDTQIKARWLFNGIIAPVPFHGLQFEIDGSFGSFSAARVNPASTLGTVIDGVSFDARHVYVNWSGVRLGDIQRFVIDVEVTPVPEPSTVALWAVGLAAMGRAATRRRSQAIMPPARRPRRQQAAA